MSDLPKAEDTEVMEPTYWKKNGWAARVIKNEDDDGWAVEIRKTGISEPVLISPWVMGRDKKNPKPFDANAFATFVKTASEVLGRSTAQNAAALMKRFAINTESGVVEVSLEVVPDEYEPYAMLTALDGYGDTLATFRVSAGVTFNRDIASAWVADGFRRP